MSKTIFWWDPIALPLFERLAACTGWETSNTLFQPLLGSQQKKKIWRLLTEANSKGFYYSQLYSWQSRTLATTLSLCPALLMSCRIDFNKLIQVGSEQMFPFSPQHFRSRNKNGFFLFLTLTVSFRLLDRCQYLYKMSSWNAEKYFLHCHWIDFRYESFHWNDNEVISHH